MRRRVFLATILIFTSLALGQDAASLKPNLTEEPGTEKLPTPRTSVKVGKSTISVCFSKTANPQKRIVVKFDLQFRNISDRTLILSKEPAVFSTNLAHSLNEAKAGKFFYGPKPTFAFGELPKLPAFGDKPDSEHFAILKPRQSITLRARDGVYFVEPGVYTAKEEIMTWKPELWFAPENDLRAKWKDIGGLETTPVDSDLFQLTIPNIKHPPDCKPK